MERCLADGVSSAAFVVHGGTIMAVMERFAETDSPRGFYDWQPENFGGWTACTTRELWRDRPGPHRRAEAGGGRLRCLTG